MRVSLQQEDAKDRGALSEQMEVFMREHSKIISLMVTEHILMQKATNTRANGKIICIMDTENQLWEHSGMLDNFSTTKDMVKESCMTNGMSIEESSETTKLRERLSYKEKMVRNIVECGRTTCRKV